DITSALYMARYRHRALQIYIVLSRDELNSESQYPQMQRENFSLAFAGSAFFAKAGSYLLIDGHLYLLSTPLSNLGAARTHTIIQASPDDAKDFMTRFRQPFLAGDFLPPLQASANVNAPAVTTPSDIKQYTKTYHYQKDY